VPGSGEVASAGRGNDIARYRRGMFLFKRMAPGVVAASLPSARVLLAAPTMAAEPLWLPPAWLFHPLGLGAHGVALRVTASAAFGFARCRRLHTLAAVFAAIRVANGNRAGACGMGTARQGGRVHSITPDGADGDGMGAGNRRSELAGTALKKTHAKCQRSLGIRLRHKHGPRCRPQKTGI
jgi:hypothetical protein